MSAPIEIQTEREGLVVRQLATPSDDVAYFEAYNASRAEVEEFKSPDQRGEYRTLQEVEQARLHPANPDRLRFGVWDHDTFVVSINLTPDTDDPSCAEIGYWADTRHAGRGNTTLAARALATFAFSDYPYLSANVVEGNDASARVLEKTGFFQTTQYAGKLAFFLTRAEFDRPLKSRGAGIIFYVEPTEQLMFYLRDDKPGISCPNMIDIIGGHMEGDEVPKETALREIGEELVDDNTGKSPVLDPDNVEHFKTFIDSRPGEHNIFVYRLGEVPNFHTVEGQGLVFLDREEARRTKFAYGYNKVVCELLDAAGVL